MGKVGKRLNDLFIVFVPHFIDQECKQDRRREIDEQHDEIQTDRVHQCIDKVRIQQERRKVFKSVPRSRCHRFQEVETVIAVLERKHEAEERRI